MTRSTSTRKRQPTVAEAAEERNPFQSFAIAAEGKAAEAENDVPSAGVVAPHRSSKRRAVAKDLAPVEECTASAAKAEEIEPTHAVPTGMRRKRSVTPKKTSDLSLRGEGEAVNIGAIEARVEPKVGGRKRGGSISLAENSVLRGSELPVNLQVQGQIQIEKRQEMLLSLADELVERLTPLKFRSPPVTCVYNPLVYAREPYEQYIRTCGGRPGVVMLVGMNPGPWGMAQTGIPFGDTVMVRDFLRISGKVSSPEKLHPKRPVDGFSCPRREVSGSRLWGWARDRYGTADTFFNRFWVYNYCPLSFMEATGKNRTPDKLHPSERDAIISHCDEILARTIAVVGPSHVIGLGKYAANRAKQCGIGPDVRVGDVLHPSPASPAANRDWVGTFESQLRALGVEL